MAIEFTLFNPKCSGNPLTVLLQTVKTQMKCSIMQHFCWVYTVKVKISSDKIIQYFLKNITLTPLDMYDRVRLSQVFCMKQKENPLVYKGLIEQEFSLLSSQSLELNEPS